MGGEYTAVSATHQAVRGEMLTSTRDVPWLILLAGICYFSRIVMNVLRYQPSIRRDIMRRKPSIRCRSNEQMTRK